MYRPPIVLTFSALPPKESPAPSTDPADRTLGTVPDLALPVPDLASCADAASSVPPPLPLPPGSRLVVSARGR